MLVVNKIASVMERLNLFSVLKFLEAENFHVLYNDWEAVGAVDPILTGSLSAHPQPGAGREGTGDQTGEDRHFAASGRVVK